jgi:hypothetical protein
VIGRGYWNGPLELPDTDRMGVWVEARRPGGARLRGFFLPKLGEVEVLEERVENNVSRWVSVNRLVSRGFTEAPPVRPQEQAPTEMKASKKKTK